MAHSGLWFLFTGSFDDYFWVQWLGEDSKLTFSGVSFLCSSSYCTVDWDSHRGVQNLLTKPLSSAENFAWFPNWLVWLRLGSFHAVSYRCLWRLCSLWRTGDFCGESFLNQFVGIDFGLGLLQCGSWHQLLFSRGQGHLLCVLRYPLFCVCNTI